MKTSVPKGLISTAATVAGAILAVGGVWGTLEFSTPAFGAASSTTSTSTVATSSTIAIVTATSTTATTSTTTSASSTSGTASSTNTTSTSAATSTPPTTSTSTATSSTSTSTTSATFTPQGIVSLSFDDGWGSQYRNAFPILQSAGLRATFYIISRVAMSAASGTSPYMTTAQLTALRATGNEIGAHTQTHPHLPTLSVSAATTEISGSRSDLMSLGLGPVDTFAYPYGEFNSTIENIVKNSGYIATRSVEPGFNTAATNPYALLAGEVITSTSLSQMESWITTAMQDKQWLIFELHHVGTESPTVSNDIYEITPQNLAALASYLHDNHIPVMTVHDAFLALHGGGGGTGGGAGGTGGNGSSTPPTSSSTPPVATSSPPLIPPSITSSTGVVDGGFVSPSSTILNATSTGTNTTSTSTSTSTTSLATNTSSTTNTTQTSNSSSNTSGEGGGGGGSVGVGAGVVSGGDGGGGTVSVTASSNASSTPTSPQGQVLGASTSTAGMDQSDILQLLMSLLAQLKLLEQQLLTLQIGQGGCTVAFTQNLSLGFSGSQVRGLQQTLNKSSLTQIASFGAGSPRNETRYFGARTAHSVSTFQTIFDLGAENGVVGSATRAVLNRLCGFGQ